ncbi:MAG: hypothetical protein WCS42_03490 [Verrucomicrobiota bacterium]
MKNKLTLMKTSLARLVVPAMMLLLSSSAGWAQTVVLSDDFASITTGDNTTTSGSSSAWTGDISFPTVASAYKAGGAVKLGTASLVGSITSKTLDLSPNGGNFFVKFDVKGWTTVEGSIKVTVTGLTAQTVTYAAVMSGTFETKTLSFTGGTAGSTVKIETTAKRAYIDNVSVYYNGAGAPIIIAPAASGISPTTATLNGNVTSDGGAAVTDRGFCYNTTGGVTINDNRTASGTGTGAFTFGISALSVNTQYYYIAYATNSVGTTLSAQTNFWTLANVPVAPVVDTPTPTNLNVTLGSGDDNPANTVYAIQETNTAKYVQADGSLNTAAVFQAATTWNTVTVSGLNPSTAYTFKVKAQNGAGTNTAFGATATGTTTSGVVPPAIITQAATALTAASATLNGTVTANNGAALTDRGYYWQVNPGVTLADNQLSEGGTAVSAFSKLLGSLSVNTVYYYRAYAVNSAGTNLDTSEVSFYTLANPPTVPTVDTITGTTMNVTLGAGDGNPANTVYAIQETNSGFYVQSNGLLGATAAYQPAADWGTKTVIGLSGTTTYAFQVKAQNGGGIDTAFSPVASGTTLVAALTLAKWDMSGYSNSGSSPQAPTASNANVTIGGLTKGAAITANTTTKCWGGVFGTTAATEAAAITAGGYGTFTVTVNSGHVVSYSDIPVYNIRRSATGPTTGIWQYSLDGSTFTDIGSAITWGTGTSSSGNPQTAIDLSGISALQNVAAGTTVTFRVVSWGASGASGTWYFNDQTSGTSDLIVEGFINASGGTASIGVLGNLAFGNVTTGTVATASITITNSGTVALNVSGIVYPSGFSGAWSGAIPANGSHTVTVSFAPLAVQSYGGTITVNSDATSGSGTLSSSGAGIAVVPPVTPVITGIQVSGGNVLIDFTGSASDAVGNFTVVSASSVTSDLASIAASITTSGPGVFRATVPFSASTPAAFYRIKH